MSVTYLCEWSDLFVQSIRRALQREWNPPPPAGDGVSPETSPKATKMCWIVTKASRHYLDNGYNMRGKKSDIYLWWTIDMLLYGIARHDNISWKNRRRYIFPQEVFYLMLFWVCFFSQGKTLVSNTLLDYFFFIALKQRFWNVVVQLVGNAKRSRK